MFPSLSVEYRANRSLSNAKHFTDLSGGKSTFAAKAPNLGNIPLGELGSAAALSGSRISASFCIHVLKVFKLCPDKQVLGVNAWRIVALVKGALTFWNRAMMN